MGLSNYLPSSRLIQPGVCTSTTRPASPFEGQVIYETDTNLSYFYDGSAWQLYGQQIAGKHQLTSAASSLSVTLPSTITNGYNLRIVASVRHNSSVSIDLGLRFNSDSGTNYDRQYLIAYDTTVAGGVSNNDSSVLVSTVGNNSASRFTSVAIDVPNFQAAYHKTVVSSSLDPRNMTSGSGASAALWLSVQLVPASGNLATDSRMTVYVTGLG